VHDHDKAIDLARCVDELSMGRPATAQARLSGLRERVRVNTYGVSAPHATVDNLANGLSYGVDYDTVRVLDDDEPLWLRAINDTRRHYFRWSRRLGN
jgi:hypothetical protein